MSDQSSPPPSAESRTEKEKMLAGEIYHCTDPVLVQERIQARQLARLFNESPDHDFAVRTELLKRLFGSTGESIIVEPPFFCDYGYNIHVGERFYANFDCIVLDVCEVRIGDNCLIGPGVHLYTATHPVSVGPRIAGDESGKPITIGHNVWLGGRAIILPGVTIGDNSIIAAGAVVTKAIPANVVAGGNPARIMRGLTEEERTVPRR